MYDLILVGETTRSRLYAKQINCCPERPDTIPQQYHYSYILLP